MNIHLIQEAGLPIIIHVACALIAFPLGMFVLFRRKGGVVHKNAGKIWAGLMVTVALTSFFIHEIRMFGPFSPIHFLSIYTLVTVAYAIWAIRNKKVQQHERSMKQIFVFGIVVAGAFTFMPHRLLTRVLGEGMVAQAAPYVWVAVPLVVYLIHRYRNGMKKPRVSVA